MEHMNSLLIGLLITGLIGTGLSIVGKIMPREKLAGIFVKWFTALAIVVTTLLLRFIPLKAVEEVEEGVFCTLSYAIRKGLEAFETKLLSDNAIQKK